MSYATMKCHATQVLFSHTEHVPCITMGAQLTAVWHRAGGDDDEWAAEGGVAPPIPPGTTQLLDDVLHVDMHAFCHKFLADGVCTLLLCLGPVPHPRCPSHHCISTVHGSEVQVYCELWWCWSCLLGEGGGGGGRGVEGDMTERGCRCSWNDSTRMFILPWEQTF